MLATMHVAKITITAKTPTSKYRGRTSQNPEVSPGGMVQVKNSPQS